MSGQSSELRLMTLREVHKEFRIPLKTLKADAKSGLARTVPIGEGTERVHRRMTEAQVREYLERRAERAAPAAQAEPEKPVVDPLREAVLATRKRQARRTGHRAFNH